MSTVDPGKYYGRCDSLDEPSRSYCREYIDQCVAQRKTRGARDSSYELVSKNGKSSTGLKFIDCIQLSPIHALHGKPRAMRSQADKKPLPKPDRQPAEGTCTNANIDVRKLKEIYEKFTDGVERVLENCNGNILIDGRTLSSGKCTLMQTITVPLYTDFFVKLKETAVGKYRRDGSRVTMREAKGFCEMRVISPKKGENTLKLFLGRMENRMRSCIPKVKCNLSNTKPKI